MKTYLLIAYKQDSSDSCRGCHMGSYPSDHQVYHGLSEERLIEKWAEFSAKELQINEAGYDFFVLNLTTGKIIYDSLSSQTSPLPLDADDDYDAYEDNNLKNFVDDRAKVFIKSREIAKVEATRKQLFERETQTKNQELAELARLKKKFES